MIRKINNRCNMKYYDDRVLKAMSKDGFIEEAENIKQGDLKFRIDKMKRISSNEDVLYLYDYCKQSPKIFRLENLTNKVLREFTIESDCKDLINLYIKQDIENITTLLENKYEGLFWFLSSHKILGNLPVLYGEVFKFEYKTVGELFLKFMNYNITLVLLKNLKFIDAMLISKNKVYLKRGASTSWLDFLEIYL